MDQLLKKFTGQIKKQGPQDLTAVDFDPRGTACVRLKKNGEEITLVAAEMLPAVDLAALADSESEAKPSFSLPRGLAARFVAMCVPDDEAVVKVLSFPGELGGDAEAQIKALLGLDEKVSFRIGYRDVSRSHGRASETKLITLALPDSLCRAAASLFPSGVPAPISIESAGLAAVTAFMHGPGKVISDTDIGVIELGVRTSFVLFLSKGQVSLIRKFDFGSHHILDAIQQSLGVDRQTATDIIGDGSFDISQLIKEASEPFIKQLVISKHFVERRENCHLACMFVPEGVPKDWLNEVNSALAMDVVTWSPFDAINVPENVITKKNDLVSSIFSSALGAGLGVFEETSA